MIPIKPSLNGFRSSNNIWVGIGSLLNKETTIDMHERSSAPWKLRVSMVSRRESFPSVDMVVVMN